MLKCTSGFIPHRLKTFILLYSSFPLGRTGTVPYFLVALLVAALLSEWKCVNPELFCSWLETARHNNTDWNKIQVTSPDWYDGTCTEQIFIFEVTLYFCYLSKSFEIVHFISSYCTNLWKRCICIDKYTN